MSKIDVSKYKNFILLNHPLIQHKITYLRDKNTNTTDFRRIVKELAQMEGYEALRHLETTEISISTPVEDTKSPVVSKNKLCFVPILRAGLGMVDGMLDLLPGTKVGHIGLYRDEKTHKPHFYYYKAPKDLASREVFIVDPMLATGGSAIDAVKLLKEKGANKINLICIIAAPEGVKAFCEEYPDIQVFAGALDRCLNEKAYICPGLGDAGDRIFGTIE